MLGWREREGASEEVSNGSSLASGHPTNFSMWSGDIQYSDLFCLAKFQNSMSGLKMKAKFRYTECVDHHN